MKKLVTAIALTVAIGFFVNQSAEARWGKGPGNGFGPGSCGNCDPNSAVDEEARQAFFEETEELRSELMSLRSEYFTLMNSDDADKDIAQDIWSRMFDIQQQIQDKAVEAGINPNDGRGPGNRNGRGCGSFKGGNGPSACNGQGCYQNNNAPSE